MKLTELPNVGKILAEHLCRAGIETPEQLREVGAEEAWLRIRLKADPGACIMELRAIAGAVEGIPDKQLTPERKAELKAFFDAHR